MVDDVLITYVAEKILDDTRAGKSVPNEIVTILFQWENAQRLRTKLLPGDIQTARRLLASQDAIQFRLGVHFLQGLKRFAGADEALRAEMFQLLKAAWQRQSLESRQRMSVMFGLTDYPQLEVDIHRESYRFVMAHHEEFLESNRTWSGGADKVLDMCEERLQNPLFPSSKAWLYLCATEAADDVARASQLVSRYVDFKPPFVAEVARDVVARLARRLAAAENGAAL